MNDSPTAHEVVNRYWTRVWLERDLEAIAESYTDPTIRHTVHGTRTVSVEQLQLDLSESLRAFRGEAFSVDQLTIDGDIAWIRLTLRGVSLAAMTPIVITWMGQYRIENDRIAETWVLHQSGLDWSTEE